MIPQPASRSQQLARRRRRRTIAGIVLSGLVLTGCAISPVRLFDLTVSLPDVEVSPELRADESRPQLVVLQHGLVRSAWSFWRLERALEALGYEVLNPSYPSTQGDIQQHAELLGQQLENCLAARSGPLPAIHFVGHSMGGLVIRSYLSRPEARAASSCVFLGTPHRGAGLAGVYADSWWFTLFAGDRSALQLVPGNSFYESLTRLEVPRVGCIYGALGEPTGWNANIPGDDDGRVGVAEAQLPEQTDSVGLRVKHTWLTVADPVVGEVLHFLKFGCFRRRPA